MARHRAAIREDHRPRDIARAAIELAIDEVGDAAKEQTDRYRLCNDVGEGKERYSTGAGVQYDRNGHAEGAAVEGHPAVPYVNRLDRMIDIVARLVEQNVSDPPSENNAERCPHQEIVDILPPDQMRRPSGQSQAIPPADQQPDNVGERIPADRKGSERDRDRIDRREGHYEEGHERACGGMFEGPPVAGPYKGGKPDRQGTWWSFGGALALQLSPGGRIGEIPGDLP